jgi:hypothetical protein
MHMPQVNYLAVLVAGIAIFMLGGLWYSPLLFAKRWIVLIGKSEEDLKAGGGKAMPLLYLGALICGMLVSWTLAVILNHFTDMSALRGVLVGVLCWIGFAGATSFANYIFSQKPKELWAIDSGYNLVSFIIAGAILGAWR